MAKKALMVYGGWEGHEPKQCVDVFAPILADDGFDVEVVDSMDVYTDKGKMAELSLVVPVWTMGTIEKEQEKGLLEAVKSGEISRDHYESYTKLREESEFYQMSYVEKRRKDRDFGRFIKSAKKDLKNK